MAKRVTRGGEGGAHDSFGARQALANGRSGTVRSGARHLTSVFVILKVKVMPGFPPPLCFDGPLDKSRVGLR